MPIGPTPVRPEARPADRRGRGPRSGDLLALTPVAVGTAVLAGWSLQIDVLRSGWASMKPNTAVCFVALGLALLAARRPAAPAARPIGTALNAFVATVAALTLFEYATGVNLGIDELVHRDLRSRGFTAAPGRMAILTALALLALSLGCVMGSRPARRAALGSQILGLTGLTIPLLAIAGWLYDVSRLYGLVPGTFGMALHTALTLVVVAVAVLGLRPHEGIVRIVTAPDAGGQMARLLLPAAVAVPFALAWVRLVGQREGLYGTEMGLALLVVSNVAVFVTLVFLTARSVSATEATRRAALEDLVATRQFRTILGATPVPTAIWRIDTGAIVYANRALLDALEWEGAEVEGGAATDLAMWADPAARDALIGRVAAAGRVDGMQCRLRRRGGATFDAIASAETVDFDGAPAVVGLFNDISDRVAAEEALRASRAHLDAFLANLPTPAALFDLDGVVVLANDAAARLYGLSASDVIGRNAADLVPAHIAEEVAQRNREVVESGRPHQEELEVPGPGGDARSLLSMRFPVFEDGRVVATGVLATDITERRRLEADVEAKAAQLRLLLESTAEGIIGLDAEGRGTFVNPAAVAALGFAPEELLGVVVHDAVHHHHEDGTPYRRVDCPSHRALHSGEASRSEGEVFWRRDGTSFPVDLACRPLLSGGQVVGAVLSFTDVTERRRRAAELEAARLEALEASRLKSEFLATMSHEIRTPMNAVIGMAGLLLDTALDAEQREYAETVRNSAQALLDIINDILDFSKLEAGRLELEDLDFDPGAVAEDVGELLAGAAHDKGVELCVNVDPELPPAVRGDPGRLRQVLTNLVGNAVKFTEQGEVVVTARLVEADQRSVVLRFEVRDTGIGIAPEAVAGLFESFSQADRSTTRRYGGTGLGLAISARLVEKMRGQIAVDSAPGAGSTFSCTIRCRPSAGPARWRPETLAGLRALIVDDLPANRQILAAQLAGWGMTAVTAASGPEALEAAAAAAAAGAPFDVVVADFLMPGMDGVELAGALAGTAAAAPVVILSSASGRESARGRAGEGSIARFLVKPPRRAQLFDAIAGAVGAAADHHRRAAPPAARAAAGGAGREARVLVVDDNPVNRRLASLLLEKSGYSVDAVADGVEAVEAVSRGRYDAVVMDCEMPRMDGYTATAEIRRLEGPAGRIPIIALTASAMKGDAERALAAGMDAHVPKPIDRSQLEGVLARLLGGETPPAGGGGVEGNRPAPDASTGPIDRARLAELRDLDAAMLPTVVGLFLRDLPARVEACVAAAGDRDPDAVRARAHAIKGSAANLGARALARVAAEIEDDAGHGRLPPETRLAELVAASREAAVLLAGELDLGDAGDPMAGPMVGPASAG